MTQGKISRYVRLAVTGLIVLIGFGVFVTNRITTARQKMAAKIGPVWDTEYIGVFDTSIHPHIPVVGQNFVSVTALNGESDRKIDKVSRAGEHRTGIDKMFDSARAFEIRYLLFGEKIGTGTSSEVERGRFSYVLEDSPYHERLPDNWYSLDSKSLTSRRYPSALILPHLPLNSINLVLRCLDLSFGYTQLSTRIFSLFLRGLGESPRIGSAGMHFVPLKGDENSCEDCNGQPISAQTKSGTLKAAHALFYICELLCGGWLACWRGIYWWGFTGWRGVRGWAYVLTGGGLVVHGSFTLLRPLLWP